ncbi:hypothetical protein PVAP13_5NG282834 [Panicum virgatum]|uniref:Uncharacterized protein n=1 Tax=Panicum virgatum TaxID=38727 RepID=A0A8T0RYV7_PANVG|nr:hypothetical protein PVAP13_5NG282834 [Panicum virgatum]
MPSATVTDGLAHAKSWGGSGLRYAATVAPGPRRPTASRREGERERGREGGRGEDGQRGRAPTVGSIAGGAAPPQQGCRLLLPALASEVPPPRNLRRRRRTTAPRTREISDTAAAPLAPRLAGDLFRAEARWGSVSRRHHTSPAAPHCRWCPTPASLRHGPTPPRLARSHCPAACRRGSSLPLLPHRAPARRRLDGGPPRHRSAQGRRARGQPSSQVSRPSSQVSRSGRARALPPRRGGCGVLGRSAKGTRRHGCEAAEGGRSSRRGAHSRPGVSREGRGWWRGARGVSARPRTSSPLLWCGRRRHERGGG